MCGWCVSHEVLTRGYILDKVFSRGLYLLPLRLRNPHRIEWECGNPARCCSSFQSFLSLSSKVYLTDGPMGRFRRTVFRTVFQSLTKAQITQRIAPRFVTYCKSSMYIHTCVPTTQRYALWAHKTIAWIGGSFFDSHGSSRNETEYKLPRVVCGVPPYRIV